MIKFVVFDFDGVFGGIPLYLDLEIGFGRGVFLRNYAQCFENRSIIGIDVRSQIVDVLNERLIKESIHNVALVHCNGSIFLEDSLPDHCLDRVFVFHPDPWLKKRHHKRRVIQHSLLDVMAKKLKIGGRLYLTTDVMLLGEEMAAICEAHPDFSNVEDTNFWAHYYQSHWDRFSIEDKRSLFKAVYEKNDRRL